MKPPPDAALAQKGKAKAKKAQKKGTGATSASGFRRYTSPDGFEVSLSYIKKT